MTIILKKNLTEKWEALKMKESETSRNRKPAFGCSFSASKHWYQCFISILKMEMMVYGIIREISVVHIMSKV